MMSSAARARGDLPDFPDLRPRTDGPDLMPGNPNRAVVNRRRGDRNHCSGSQDHGIRRARRDGAPSDEPPACGSWPGDPQSLSRPASRGLSIPIRRRLIRLLVLDQSDLRQESQNSFPSAATRNSRSGWVFSVALQVVHSWKLTPVAISLSNLWRRTFAVLSRR